MQVISKSLSFQLPQNITICGAGAVGSFLAFVLSRATRNVALVDPDNFEPHNIATHFISVHSTSKVTAKVESVKATIDSFLPSAVVHAYHCRGEEIQRDATIDATDVFITATDSVQSRIAILQKLTEFNKPVADVGISPEGYNITILSNPEEIQQYINVLQNKNERTEDTQRTCQDARNTPVIASLTAELLQVLSDLQKAQGDESNGD